MTQSCTNGTLTLQCVPIKISHNMHWIDPYTYDTKIKDIKIKIICENINICSPVIFICSIINLLHKVFKWIGTETLEIIYIVCARKVFHNSVILFTLYVPPVTR